MKLVSVGLVIMRVNELDASLEWETTVAGDIRLISTETGRIMARIVRVNADTWETGEQEHSKRQFITLDDAKNYSKFVIIRELLVNDLQGRHFQ